MSIADYQPFIERVIQRYEGGYGWDRSDPGGPTKYGITCFDLAEYDHQRMDSMVRWAPIVKVMSLETAEEIFDVKYAPACAFNALNIGCDCVVLDFGINSGSSRSIRYAQSIVGVAVDGVAGPVTVAAINAYDPDAFVNHLCDARLAFLQGLGTWSTFGGGWSARVADLRTYCLNLLHPPRTVDGPYVSKLERIPLAYAKGYSDVQ